ncbi:MAG TPA: Trm112 family protein [Thermomicrobiales bacterium]|nr:Trm112 family protein [Thermomicrobiales bacterium]
MTDRAADASAAPLPVDLLEILVCPVDKAPVRQDGAQLICTRCGRRYPIEDGIPNMLVDVEPDQP